MKTKKNLEKFKKQKNKQIKQESLALRPVNI